MPTRYLKPGIRDSERIEALLTPDAEILYYRLIVSVDDFGRTDARPLMLKSLCFPIRLRATADKCMQWLQDLVNSGLVSVYGVDGKSYLQITKWDNKPRAEHSKYPDPRTDADNCIQMLPVTVNLNREPETVNREPETKTVNRKPRVDARATRLPADWAPPNEWMEWAKNERRWSTEQAQATADKFKDHWIASASKNARKLDWQATWRNWVRSERGGSAGKTSGNHAAAQEFVRRHRDEG